MGRLFFIKQHDTIDCGPSCLAMISGYYGKKYSLEYLREKCYLNREGVSIVSISDAAEGIGFRTLLAKLDKQSLIEDCPLPCILHWRQEHFVVLYKITQKKRWLVKNRNKSGSWVFKIADPGHAIIELDEKTFLNSWISTSDDRGVVLVLEPTPQFHSQKGNYTKSKGYGFLFRYLFPYKKYLFQLILGMTVVSLITMIFPFLTQVLIDVGVVDKNYSVIYLVFLSQIFLFLGSTVIEIIRSWLLLHINTRISLSIISDFLIKLLKLPIKYFDSKSVGDISQRINDHHRIENFLTGAVLNSMFSFINIVVFALVLAFYNFKILLIFSFFSIVGVLWIIKFQNRRKHLDYKRFARNRENQDKLYEMIGGMQEIKLYGSETPKRWEWERLQVKSFKLNIKSLALEQYQHSGITFFNYIKNIIVSFISVNVVVQGHMSVGALLSISYIIGQTNGPVEQLADFLKSGQDAQLSLARLQEIHLIKDEEDSNVSNSNTHAMLGQKSITINELSYQYEGPRSPLVLNNISMVIPKGKITAIVGTSGSGKTTLLKLLLKYYEPVNGSILVGENNLNDLSAKDWRRSCGTVLQDGYIFNDTITGNIAMDGKEINEEQMEKAVTVANCKEFIEEMPLGYTTKIGASGTGISGGQRQRILIARAIYKNPDYIFFDEATSSLDANTEKVIMNNLNEFFRGKTVVIIAHRLSTVKNADQIIVLEKGSIVEMGTHNSLIKQKGNYFELVKNQLELGN